MAVCDCSSSSGEMGGRLTDWQTQVYWAAWWCSRPMTDLVPNTHTCTWHYKDTPVHVRTSHTTTHNHTERGRVLLLECIELERQLHPDPQFNSTTHCCGTWEIDLTNFLIHKNTCSHGVMVKNRTCIYEQLNKQHWPYSHFSCPSFINRLLQKWV